MTYGPCTNGDTTATQRYRVAHGRSDTALGALDNGMRMNQDDFARALEVVTGLPISLLGFAAVPGGHVADDQQGGHDLTSPVSNLATPTPAAEPSTAHRSYEGVWLSRYQYYSSGREESFAGQHFVVLL